MIGKKAKEHFKEKSKERKDKFAEDWRTNYGKYSHRVTKGDYKPPTVVLPDPERDILPTGNPRRLHQLFTNAWTDIYKRWSKNIAKHIRGDAARTITMTTYLASLLQVMSPQAKSCTPKLNE